MADRQQPASKQPSSAVAQQGSQQPAQQEQSQEKDPRKKGRDFVHDPDDFVDVDEMYEKGYYGTRDTPFDDKEFTLETGPHSPGAVDLEDPDSYDGSAVTERE